MNADADDRYPIPLVVFSDFVCPWCYIGFVEVEPLVAAYDLELQFAPFLLDPTTPLEGKPRRQMTQPGDPPSALEQRGSELGITFARGRERTSNSLLAHQAAAFAAEHGDPIAFHRRMFRAYFEDLEDIGVIDTVVRIGAAAGLPEAELREALVSGRYRAQVDEELEEARQIGVTAVPTFIVGEQYAVVGAQEALLFEDLLRRKFDRTPNR